MPFPATALRTESLYGFLFLRLRRTESLKLWILVEKHPEIVPFKINTKRSVSTKAARFVCTPATPSFFPVGENDRQLLLICSHMKYFMTVFSFCFVILIN